MIKNPISFVQNTRQVYNKQLERVIVEVEINIEGVPKTWIPLETLMALTYLIEND
jgi:hypothetical protein